MISTKDNLLVRPWQQKRYNYHREKVQSAKPAIDNKPPLPRQHVALKLKKKQKETERCREIEKENFNLLKRLSYLMRTKRVDNFWTKPQPNFLHRVSMIHTKAPKVETFHYEESKVADNLSKRKLKCLACNPQPVEKTTIPEERLPWQPEKPSISKFRSKSMPVSKTENMKIKTKENPVSNKEMSKVKSASSNSEKRTTTKICTIESQSLVLSRGCLKLSINFPSDATIKLQQGRREKFLIQNTCNCRNPTGITV